MPEREVLFLMKHWHLVFLLAITYLTISLSSAGASYQVNTAACTRKTRISTQQPAPISAFVRDTIPSAGEISGTGILKQIDDAGYPIALLTIYFPEQKLTEQFILNLEEVRTVQLTTLLALVGNTISVRYTAEQTNALLDIDVGGRFLLEADAGVVTNETSKVTGVLSADEITTGDVPGLLLITAADGEVTEFPFFITSDLLEVNGTTVTAFYEERTTNTIRAITIVK